MVCTLSGLGVRVHVPGGDGRVKQFTETEKPLEKKLCPLEPSPSLRSLDYVVHSYIKNPLMGLQRWLTSSEDQALIPSTHMVARTNYSSSLKRSYTLFWLPGILGMRVLHR